MASAAFFRCGLYDDGIRINKVFRAGGGFDSAQKTITDLIGRECEGRILSAIYLIEDPSLNITVCPQLAKASVFPSGEKATEKTSLE